jgi:D-alanyl-D-alanine carboxypeptidase
MSMRRGLIPFLALLVCAVAAAPATASPAKRADAKLDRALKDFVVMEGGPPGISAVIDRGGKAKLHRAGVRSVRSRKPLRKSDHMRIASVAKALSGAVALSLVDQGKLSLDDTIGEVLPGLGVAWPEVTLRELLQHTSGIPTYTNNPQFRADFTANLRRYFSPQEIVAYVADEPLEFPAGSHYEYSNTDNFIIALMAEAATGRSYERNLRELVYKPLGLRRTSLPDGALLPRPFIHGYGIAPPDPPEDVSQAISASGIWASGGIVSTPGDMNRFVRGYVRGALYSKAVRDQQLNFLPGAAGEPRGPGSNSGGLALYRYKTSCGTVLGHTGNFPGYTQFIAASPNGRRSTVVSVNEQIDVATGPPGAFPPMRHIFELAACAALARR